MKTKLFFLLIGFAVVVNNAFGQMNRGDKIKIAELNERINECRNTVSSYEVNLINLVDCSGDIKKLQTEADSLKRLVPETKYGKELKTKAVKENGEMLSKLLKQQKRFETWNPKISEKDSLLKKIKGYELQKEEIFQAYVTSNELPTEMSNYRESRRFNSLNVARAERIENTEALYAEMDIRKLSSGNVKGDAVKGYEGIIQNFCRYSYMQFDFYRVNANGTLSDRLAGSYLTFPGQKKIAYLLPGTYSCIVYRDGEKVDQKTFPVTAELLDFFEEKTHWYAARRD